MNANQENRQLRCYETKPSKKITGN